MKTEYEYISFEIQEEKPKTILWACKNKKSGGTIGHVGWYGPWRQYCFMPGELVVLSAGCLSDITHFVRQVMRERKK